MEVKEQIKNRVRAYGVNENVIGYEMVCDLIKYMYDDIQNGKKPKMSDHYYRLAVKYNISQLSVGNALRYAVCVSNEYGKGLNVKTLVENVLRNL